MRGRKIKKAEQASEKERRGSGQTWKQTEHYSDKSLKKKWFNSAKTTGFLLTGIFSGILKKKKKLKLFPSFRHDCSSLQF